MSEEPKSDRKPIGENTTVRLAVVITLLSFAIFLTNKITRIDTKVDIIMEGQKQVFVDASGMRARLESVERTTTKIDVAIEAQKTLSQDIVAFRTRIESLEQTSRAFTDFGSPALRARIDPIEKSVERINTLGSLPMIELKNRVDQLAKDFDIHKATAK